jgi:hypothetical protein
MFITTSTLYAQNRLEIGYLRQLLAGVGNSCAGKITRAKYSFNGIECSF